MFEPIPLPEMTSAAIHFDPAAVDRVPPDWADEAVRLLALSGLPLRKFEAASNPGYEKARVVLDPTSVGPLRDALAAAPAVFASLWARKSERNEDLVGQAVAEVDVKTGLGLLVFPASVGLSLRDTLMAAYRLTRLLAPAVYGIAFPRPGGWQSPISYALGMGSEKQFGHLTQEELETSELIGKWRDELLWGGRRHLRGGFRSVYPVQLVSEAHRQARLETGQTVGDLPLGTWTPFEDGLWIWELGEEEVFPAWDALQRSGLLLAA